jgi:hypothetical protein
LPPMAGWWNRWQRGANLAVGQFEINSLSLLKRGEGEKSRVTHCRESG